MFSWFHQKGYAQGVFWAIMVCLVSSLNDVAIRFVGRLDGMQIAFMRFAFSALFLVPVIYFTHKESFKTRYLGFHMIRAVFIYGAIVCWSMGVGFYKTPLSVASTLAQTTALFVLPMAFFFLKEKISLPCLLATLAGFTGITIMVNPDFNLSSLTHTTHIGSLLLVLAAILFAASDIFNKCLIHNENMLTIMFYIAAGATIIGAYPAYTVWQTPHLHEFMALCLLGVGANLILFCLLKAFSATNISHLAPYRYLELLFATGFGFILFREVPTTHALIGASIIVLSTFTIAWHEAKGRHLEKKG